MDLASKYQIVEMIIQSNNDTLLKQIKTLLDSSEDNFGDNLPDDVKKKLSIDRRRSWITVKGSVMMWLWKK